MVRFVFDGVDAIALDLDGVLVDSAAAIERAWQWWADRRSLRWNDVARHIPGRHATETIREVLPELDEDEIHLEADAVNHRQIGDGEQLEPIPGMLRFVEAIPDERWAVVTGCPLELAEFRLQKVGFPPPSVLVTADDVLVGKPDPQGYQLAAARLGASNTACVAMEDSPAGIAAAVTAGMRVIGLLTTHRSPELDRADVLISDATALKITNPPLQVVVTGPEASRRTSL